jgi:hypothetical protein
MNDDAIGKRKKKNEAWWTTSTKHAIKKRRG